MTVSTLPYLTHDTFVEPHAYLAQSCNPFLLIRNNNEKADVEKQAEPSAKPVSKWAALRYLI